MTGSRAETRVMRYEVPVDDQWHDVEITGSIRYVNSRRAEVVEFWTMPDPWLTEPHTETLRVFGTGQPIDDYPQYVGSAIVADGALVWHLFRKVLPDA